MSPYASIALLALVLSVAAQNSNVHKTTVNANVNWDKNINAAIGNVNVNGKSTPFTVSIQGNSNQQPTFTIQSQNPQGKTTTVKIIPIKPITSQLPPQTKPSEPPKPVHHEVPVPIQSAAPIPVPMPAPKPMEPVAVPVPVPVPIPSNLPPTPGNKPVVTSVRTSSSTVSSSFSSSSTFTSSSPGKPTVTVRSQTIGNSNEKPVTVTVISVSKPASEPVRVEPGVTFVRPTPASTPPSPPTNVVTTNTEPAKLNCEHPMYRHLPQCEGRHNEEKKRRGCNKRLWIKGIILGLAAFGALAFLALCCRICRGRKTSCCCRRRHPECERNPTYGIPAPVPMNVAGQPQVFVVQAQPVNDPYFQPPASAPHTGRSAQPFVQLNETGPDVSANYVIGYPQPNDQPIYMVPHRH